MWPFKVVICCFYYVISLIWALCFGEISGNFDWNLLRIIALRFCFENALACGSSRLSSVAFIVWFYWFGPYAFVKFYVILSEICWGLSTYDDCSQTNYVLVSRGTGEKGCIMFYNNNIRLSFNFLVSLKVIFDVDEILMSKVWDFAKMAFVVSRMAHVMPSTLDTDSRTGCDLKFTLKDKGT